MAAGSGERREGRCAGEKVCEGLERLLRFILGVGEGGEKKEKEKGEDCVHGGEMTCVYCGRRCRWVLDCTWELMLSRCRCVEWCVLGWCAFCVLTFHVLFVRCLWHAQFVYPSII